MGATGRNTAGTAGWTRRAAALLLCAALTACGGGEKAANDPWQAAGVEAEEVLLTVDGREIPGWEYLYWLSLTCDRLKQRYHGGDTDWAAAVEGGTLGEYAKAVALRDTALYAEAAVLAERYGLELGQEDQEAVEGQWQARCAAYGGEEAYLRGIARFCLDRQRAEALFRTGRLYGKLWALCREGGGPAPDQETMDALARESGAIRVDRILSAAGENRSAARSRAEAFFVRLNGAENQEAMFSVLAAEGDDHAGPRNLEEGTLEEKLVQVGRALEVGELSGIIATEEGYSILLRLPPDRQALLDQWLGRTLEEAAEQAEIQLTETYAALDTAAFVHALDAFRDEIGAQASSS